MRIAFLRFWWCTIPSAFALTGFFFLDEMHGPGFFRECFEASFSVCVLGLMAGLILVVFKRLRQIGGGVIAAFLAAFLCCIVLGLAFQREDQRFLACQVRMKQLYLGLMMYAEDHKGFFPPESGNDGLDLLQTYFQMPLATVCPIRSRKKARLKYDYDYYGGLNLKSDPETILLADKPDNHPGSYWGITISGRFILKK